MGLDVNLYAEGDVTDEELAVARAYMLARCSIIDTYDGKYPGLGWAPEGYYDRPRIELNTSQRYYGAGYERGDWPSIYGAIRLLQTALPQCRVFYGSDSSDDGLECTEESLAETWAHFLGPHGDDYRDEMRAWNRQQAMRALYASSGEEQGERAHGDGTTAQGGSAGESGEKR